MTTDNKEVRYFKLELRQSEEESGKLEGYAAVFNSESRDLGGFTEVITPGAFQRSLAASKDIKALFNHDFANVIGRRKNNTLQLTEDERGLKVAITPPNTQFGRDIVESVRAGYLDNMSFGFFVKKDAWELRDGQPDLRTLEDVELIEVSVVSEPAYLDTSIAARSHEAAVEAAKPEEQPEVEASREDNDAEAYNLKFKLNKHKSVD